MFVVVTFVLSSCQSPQKIAYIQNSDSISYEMSRLLYDARVMPKDILTITVSTTHPEAAAPFNQTVPTAVSVSQPNSYSLSQPVLQNYLVDNNGDITYPVVGRLHVGGLTKAQVEQLVFTKIKPYMAESENPIVNVRMTNYKVSVLGEVTRPGMFTVTNEKINIFEALAQAGDLTIYGKRENVKLIREDATGKKQVVTLNLNDANIINSPFYYLQQNDILYVEPNKAKAQNSEIGSMTTLWVSMSSIGISLVSLLYNVLK